MTTTTYRIVKIPSLDGRTTEQEQLALAHKFREFRLFALKTAPGAYASTYDVEVQRGIDQTFERLRNAKAAQFVALASEKPTTSTAHVCEGKMSEMLKNDWLGFIVLLGPEASLGSVSAAKNPYSQITEVPKIDAPVEEVREDGSLRYHLNGMFVHPSVRRCGVGERLIRAALNAARTTSTGNGNGYRCGIITDEWNDTARKLYERVGFKVVARETYGGERVALRMELRQAADEDAVCENRSTIGGCA